MTGGCRNCVIRPRLCWLGWVVHGPAPAGRQCLMSVAGELGLGQGGCWSIAGTDHMSEPGPGLGSSEAGLQWNLWLQPPVQPLEDQCRGRCEGRHIGPGSGQGALITLRNVECREWAVSGEHQWRDQTWNQPVPWPGEQESYLLSAGHQGDQPGHHDTRSHKILRWTLFGEWRVTESSNRARESCELWAGGWVRESVYLNSECSYWQ